MIGYNIEFNEKNISTIVPCNIQTCFLYECTYNFIRKNKMFEDFYLKVLRKKTYIIIFLCTKLTDTEF